MSSTVLTGPILAGNVLNSDGTGNLAGVGGSSGTQNVGFVQMAQFASITESASATATSIVIPAQSLITDIYINVTASWTSGSDTLNIGTASGGSQLASAIAHALLVQGQYTVPVTSLIANWLNSSATQDVQIWTQSTGSGTGTAVLVVCYLQAANNFTNGQYT